MNSVDKNVRVIVLGILAFGFLAFYISFVIEGTHQLTVCQHESGAAVGALATSAGNTGSKVPETCPQINARLKNELDLFTPISGVVTAVALAALAYKPDAPGNVALRMRGNRAAQGTGMHYVDLMIVLYLLGWTAVGIFVCFRTAGLSLENATKWDVGWLRSLGRSWWPSALTAVALWMGVPADKANQQHSVPHKDKQLG